MKKLNILVIMVVVLASVVVSLLSNNSVYAAACTNPTTSYGTDTMSLTVQTTSTYYIWLRLNAPSTSSNSVLLQVDSSNCFNVGGSASMPLNTWTWVNYQNGSTSSVMQMSLSAGSHTFKLIGNTPSLGVDTILLLGNNTCTPTGTGANCTATSTGSSGSGSSGQTTSTSTQSSSSSSSKSSTNKSSPLPATALSGSGNSVSLTPNNTTQTISTPVTVNPTYIAGQSISLVKYYLNNKLVYTATKSPYTYYLKTNKLENGTYKLTSVTYYSSGKTYSAGENIVVHHPIYKNALIYIENNILTFLLIIVVLGAGIWLGIKYRYKLSDLLNRNKPELEELNSLPTKPSYESKIVQPSVNPTPTPEEPKDDTGNHVQ